MLHALVCLLREFSLPDFVLGLHDVASEARITIACGAILKSMQSSYEIPLALAQLALHTYLLFDCNFRQLFWHQIWNIAFHSLQGYRQKDFRHLLILDQKVWSRIRSSMPIAKEVGREISEELLLFEQSRGDVFSLFLSSWGYGEAWQILSFLEYYVTTEEENWRYDNNVFWQKCNSWSFKASPVTKHTTELSIDSCCHRSGYPEDGYKVIFKFYPLYLLLQQ